MRITGAPRVTRMSPGAAPILHRILVGSRASRLTMPLAPYAVIELFIPPYHRFDAEFDLHPAGRGPRESAAQRRVADQPAELRCQRHDICGRKQQAAHL